MNAVSFSEIVLSVLLTIIATKTTRPNANDIDNVSPNVHAPHAKKFNRNIPDRKGERKIKWIELNCR